jgi:GntR family transcriptional regulator, transcriptional repressor for pyruvate dehydrogenase complex
MLELGRIPMHDFTEARILITEVVVRLASERATKKDFDAIAKDIDRVEAALARGQGYRDLNVITEFYDLLAAATGNQMLRFIVHSIAQVLTGLIRTRQPAPIPDLVEQRRDILKKLRARHAAGASRLLTNHLMRVHARMTK